MTSEERVPCRDFERGVCSRGEKCRYYHPEGVNPLENGKLPICKDFQNRGCDRFKCKFLHITVEEEAEYNRSGSLPSHGGRAEKGANISPDGREVCKDFLNNMCDRGSRCKFSHSPVDVRLDPSYGKRFRNEYAILPPGTSPNLIEENELLRRKITELQKQVLELRQMNDTLYNQNAQYRAQLHGNHPTLAPGGQSPAAAPAYMMSPVPYSYAQVKF